MKIQHLQIIITPAGKFSPYDSDIRVEVLADGITHSTIIYANDNDFVSEFDFYMAEARREILRLIKNT